MNNGKIGVAIIGSGRAGMIHAQNFRKNVPYADVVALVDPAAETLAAACRELGVDRGYHAHTEALSDPDVDAIVIVAPTTYHRDIVVDAAHAGKHVLCEKPMAMSVQDCDDMIAATDKAGVVLQIGFMRRFDSAFQRARAVVDSGEIGEVVMIRSNTRGPSVPQPWMYDLKKSNGPLAEVNSHDIDTLRWFSGSEFETIYAVGGNYRCPDARKDYPDFYDNVIVAATFRNQVQGQLDGAQGVGYAYDARVEVLGTTGCVFIGRLRDEAVLTCTGRNGREPLVDSWRGLFRDAYLREDIAFIDCIRNGTAPLVTGHDGREAVRVVNAGNRSIREKRIVRLDEAL